MVSGRDKLPVDQNFFERESGEKKWYVLGAFFSCFTPKGNNSLIFRDSQRDLVVIVKTALKSGHAIQQDSRQKHSFWLSIYNVPELINSLNAYGLDAPKNERIFPKNIPEEYLGDFIRGFTDTFTPLKIHNGYRCLKIQLSHDFIKGVNDAFIQYADIGNKKTEGNIAVYGVRDTKKICEKLIYSGWEKRMGNPIYLRPPHMHRKKELFDLNYAERPKKENLHTIKMNEKIREAQSLLLNGLPVEEVAKLVGYSGPDRFTKAFKIVHGVPPGQWRKNSTSR